MKTVSLLLAAGCVAVASAASLRASEMEGPIEGLPPGGVPILPEHLDFAAGLKSSDFVFDVLTRTPNQGMGGTVQARESPNTPALQGQGIALSLFTIDPGAQNLIHYHPRATELLYVIKGTIEVGFTDTTGTLHLNNVNAGQATVFPRALLHFQRNIGEETAQYISILNSENPGVMSFPRVFATLPDKALSQALRVPVERINELQANVLPPQLSEGGENPNYDGAAGPNGNAPVPKFGGDGMPSYPSKPSYPSMGGYPSGEGDEKSISELYKKLLEYLKK